ncbi:MAG: PilN domain-containing protein [Fusobacteriaceae bacterium]
MFNLGRKREKKFIFTNLDDYVVEFEKEENRKKGIILGLSNDDFRIALLNIDPGLNELKREEEIEQQLRMMIVGYDPMEYITRTLAESKELHNERIMAISLEREKIEEITDFAKKNKIRLKGIYPSFILDEQENLSDILMQLPSINVGESLMTESESEELQLTKDESHDKINLLLTEDGEPLNIRKKIIDGEEEEYNFLDDVLVSEIKTSGILDNMKKFFWVALLAQILFFGFLKINGGSIKKDTAQITAENVRTEARLKELDGKIASVPNFEMKLRKLQEIMDTKSPGANEVLFALRKSIAQGVFIENIKITGAKIELVGTADTADSVYEFQRNLVKEGFFKINSSPLNNAGQFYTFKIEANIK